MRILRQNNFFANTLVILTILSVVFLGGFGMGLSVASAHEYKTSGTYRVLLHVEPYDDPAVNEITHLYFNFEDSADRLNLLDGCDCVLEIVSNRSGNTEMIFSSALSEIAGVKTEERNIAVPIMFPSKGVFTVLLHGAPQNTESFKMFDLRYDVRVERGETVPVSAWQKIKSFHLFQYEHFFHLIIVIVGLCAWYFFIIRSKK